jgi:uncharacterized membrane protein (DUF373 family)
VIVAVVADAIEGVSLLNVLRRTRVAVDARRAQVAALIKFAVLTGALGYVAAIVSRPMLSGKLTTLMPQLIELLLDV